jgi:2,3-bisphosphoglycerate-independent phosphoglycerate mutase
MANKTVLCIVDGLGYSPNVKGNAVTAAEMPNLTKILAEYPSCYIKASGKEVGLDSDKDAGNSEVGHNAIGAGQTIKQGLSLINGRFSDGSIFNGETWKNISQTAKRGKLDIIILLSDGRVHSDIAHLFAVLDQCKREDLTVSIFAIADGRDVVPHSIKDYISQTNDYIGKIGVRAKIAVVGGRGQIFMDRYESQTELLTRAFEVCVDGSAEVVKMSGAEQYIDDFYKNNPGVTDEQLPPFVLDGGALISDGDAVLLLNYRGDRAIETARMFDEGAYITGAQFDRIKNCYFAGILQYDSEKNLPRNYLCEPPVIENTLTAWLCGQGIKQYTVTETVKFGHLTYFFNGNKTQPENPALETWAEIESDKLNNQYDKAPKMKAAEIADKLIFNIRHGDYSFFKCNFPNPDMVGHTGDFDAAVTACRFVDKQLGRLYDVCKTDGVNLIVTADHGNAEEMLDGNGNIKTSHTNNLVPFAVCPFGSGGDVTIKEGDFGLTNIAATVCTLLGVAVNPAFNVGILS